MLRDFKPDIIQVEAEPWSVLYAQVAGLRRLVAARAKLVLFTWWNTARTIPFPVSLTHRACLGVTDFVIAGNHGALDVLHSHGYRGPVAVVPQLGVDIDLYSPTGKPSSLIERLELQDAFVVGYVGRLTKPKGVDTVLEAMAFANVRNGRLLIVGDGPERDSLEAQAAALGAGSAVRFAGAVERGAIPAYLRCMDVLVLPSTREQWEQFGHVLIEAMACGVPVVGSTSGEIPSIIDDAGMVFPMRDAGQLGACLARLAGDAELWEQCRQRGLDRVTKQYSHAAVARTLINVYDHIVTD